MTKERLTGLIRKMLDIIKPSGVKYIEFDLEEEISDNEYYMSIIYIVPEDSEHLRSVNMRNSDLTRRYWNYEIQDTIQNYFNVDVVITSSRIRTESWNNS